MCLDEDFFPLSFNFVESDQLPERSHKRGYSFSLAWGKKMGLYNDESCLFLGAAQCLRTLRHVCIICSSFLTAMAKTDTGCLWVWVCARMQFLSLSLSLSKTFSKVITSFKLYWFIPVLMTLVHFRSNRSVE